MRSVTLLTGRMMAPVFAARSRRARGARVAAARVEVENAVRRQRDLCGLLAGRDLLAAARRAVRRGLSRPRPDIEERFSTTWNGPSSRRGRRPVLGVANGVEELNELRALVPAARKRHELATCDSARCDRRTRRRQVDALHRIVGSRTAIVHDAPGGGDRIVATTTGTGDVSARRHGGLVPGRARRGARDRAQVEPRSPPRTYPVRSDVTRA